MGHYSRRHISLGKQDFQRVFQNNKRFAESGLLVLSRKNQLDRSRLGLAVSKKHMARAVDRNRVKRLVRQSFIQHQPFPMAWDVVVVSCSGLSRQTNQQIFSSLEKLWNRTIRGSLINS